MSVCLLLNLLYFSGAVLKAQQDSASWVMYTPEFKFREGIFLNFEQVRNNDPIHKSRILTPVDYSDRDFYTKVLENKKLLFYDHLGVRQEVRSDDVWGFSRNGILFVAIDEKYHRITIVGRICHFVATITTYNTRYYDPYYYNPYYSNAYYYNRYSMPQTNVASSDLRQYLLDFETGDVMEYDVESVEVLLMKDPELADEYHALRTRKQKQMKFVYIRLFNEKHPLYFPASDY